MISVRTGLKNYSIGMIYLEEERYMNEMEKRMEILEAEMDEMAIDVENMKKIIAAIKEIREVIANEHSVSFASLFWVDL